MLKKTLMTVAAMALVGMAGAQAAKPTTFFKLGVNGAQLYAYEPAKFPDPEKVTRMIMWCDPAKQKESKEIAEWAKKVGGTFTANPPIFKTPGLTVDCSNNMIKVTTKNIMDSIVEYDSGRQMMDMYEELPDDISYSGAPMDEPKAQIFTIDGFPDGSLYASASLRINPFTKRVANGWGSKGAVLFTQNGKSTQFFLEGGATLPPVAYDTKKPYIFSVYYSDKKLWTNVEFNFPTSLRAWVSTTPNGAAVSKIGMSKY